MDNQQEIEYKIRNHPNRRGFISKSELETLYLEQKLSDTQIAQLKGLRMGQVHRLRNKYQIKAIEPHQRHHRQELSQSEKEFLVGVLLGDGHLRWRKLNSGKSYPELMLEQCVQHYEYVRWLREQIKDWEYDPDKPLKQARKLNKKTGQVYHSYPIKTICHPALIEFYHGFYQNQKKVLDIEFTKQYFTRFSLAVWIMDDGTKSKDRNMILCSQSFTKQENESLSRMLSEKFQIDSRVLENNQLYNLSFNKLNSIKLTNLVKPLVIPQMQYKLISSETTKQSN